MLIKISALIYTLASIAFITLMIMRPAVEIETQPVQNNTITVNADNPINTESDSTITPIASPNENVDNIPVNTSSTATESTTSAIDNAAMPEVPTTMPAAGEIAPQNSTEAVVPTPLENVTDTNQINSTAPTTIPTSPPATTVIPATVAPAPVVAPPSHPVTTTPAENPVVAPSAVPTEASPTPVSPQSHLNNPENQGGNVVHNSALAAPASEEQVVFPNANTTIPNQVTTPSVKPIVTDAVQQIPSNVIDTPLADVLPEDEKKNIQ